MFHVLDKLRSELFPLYVDFLEGPTKTGVVVLPDDLAELSRNPCAMRITACDGRLVYERRR